MSDSLYIGKENIAKPEDVDSSENNCSPSAKDYNVECCIEQPIKTITSTPISISAEKCFNDGSGRGDVITGIADGGSDSGVEVMVAAMAPVRLQRAENGSNVQALQRAFSNNSTEYTSSSGGGCGSTSINGSRGCIDDITYSLNMSCDSSSLLSYNSEVYDTKLLATSLPTAPPKSLPWTPNYDGCSENGSESSSFGGCGGAGTSFSSAATMPRRMNNIKKKVAMFETTASQLKQAAMDSNTTGISRNERSDTGAINTRCKNTAVKRTASLPRSSLQGSTKREGLIEKRVPATVSGSGRILHAAPSTGTPSKPSPITRTASRPQKPDSLPNALNRTQSMSMQRLVQRTPSLSRARTPGTPSDDGRWPSICTNSITMRQSPIGRRGVSAAPESASVRLRSAGLGPTNEIGSLATTIAAAGNPYGTLPRRRRQKSVEDLSGRGGVSVSRSSSISRDSRMASSVIALDSSRKKLFGGVTTNSQMTSSLHVRNSSSAINSKGTPHHLGQKKSAVCGANANSVASNSSLKTRIFHEIGVQTALTHEDLLKLLAGENIPARPVDAAEQREQASQCDMQESEIESMREEIHGLNVKLQNEREEKLLIQRELHLNTERVIAMLGMARLVSGSDGLTPTSDEDGRGSAASGGHDSLMMLESQIQISGHELMERQHEICQLRHICRSLQAEMKRSQAAQQCLQQEKVALEQESNELQDFLQHEKAAMCDALRDLEAEHEQCKKRLLSRDEEIKVLRDECRHLVRLNEQRRQENSMLQTKYSALDAKMKEILLQHNSSISGASVALSGLHTRLDNLVEQLVASYNISEEDLDDNAFNAEPSISSTHPEIYNAADETNINNNDVLNNDIRYDRSSLSASNYLAPTMMTASPNAQMSTALAGSLSPQRNESFIAAVISAIRNATAPSAKRLLASRNSINHENASQTQFHQTRGHNGADNSNDTKTAGDSIGAESDSTEMLDSETEPCLMMDNVLEDVALPDSHSHNLVSSSTAAVNPLNLTTNDLLCRQEVANTAMPTASSDTENLIAAGISVSNAPDASLNNLSQAIINRQQCELQVNAQKVQKFSMKLNLGDNSSISEDIASCHDSIAEVPSLVAEYCVSNNITDQVLEVDTLVTRLLKVLHLIQMDNDGCIQQLIIDKNKLQQNKEDMLEKLKELQDSNVKLQDDLMDATQELIMKNNDLSAAKADVQRHRNEIDRLNEDICNLSTLCSNYKKLSPTWDGVVDFTQTKQAGNSENDETNEISSIMSLLKMWKTNSLLNDERILRYLNEITFQDKEQKEQHKLINERLRIYANQLENVWNTLNAYSNLDKSNPELFQLLNEIQVIRVNATWVEFIETTGGGQRGLHVAYSANGTTLEHKTTTKDDNDDYDGKDDDDDGEDELNLNNTTITKDELLLTSNDDFTNDSNANLLLLENISDSGYVG